MTTILTKIKHKGILFEKIQGYVSKRHYILNYLINNDKVYQEQLKIYNGILKDNQLSKEFMDNLFCFISDRMLFQIINEEKDILKDKNFYPDDTTNIYQEYKKRIIFIFNKGDYLKGINISIAKLRKFLPKKDEFALFIFDYLQQKGELLSIFPSYNINLNINFNINKFLSFYDENKTYLDNYEKEVLANEMETFYAKMNRKVLINLAFIGNKNSGKSTTIGHLLLNTGNIGIHSQLYISAFNEAAQMNFNTYKYSFLVNTHRHERLRRQTIMYHLNKFETVRYDFNLIDLPGDFHLRKNIIKGLSLADVAVFVVSAEDEKPENNHINDYLIIAYTRGIRQVIFAINKMDLTKDQKYSEEIFLKIKSKMLNSCLNIGFSTDNIQFIPYSGFTGHNLVNKYEDDDFGNNNKMNWYNGKTLLESLDEIKPVKRDFDKPLLISIFKAYLVNGVDTVLRGKILSGKFMKNKKNIVLNLKHDIITPEIGSIQIYDNIVEQAVAGDIISFNIKNSTIQIGKECVLAFNETENMKILFPEWPSKNLFSNNLKEINYFKKNSFRAKIFMINKKASLKLGFTLTLFCYSISIPVKLSLLEYLVDGGNRILQKEPKEIKYGSYAIVTIDIIQEKSIFKRPKKIRNIILQKYKNNSILGSFELFNDYFMAIGKIIDI